ncbi:MAG: hypothetical protein H6553_10875 [Chitinophagales bacterium]|nr:hypothetical protein [Chitinophagales bacterium]
MKSIKIIVLSVMTVFALSVLAKSTKVKSTFFVNGVCDQCKERIETAALNAGANKAYWSETTKDLSVVYDKDKIDLQKIQKAIALVGHDNAKYKAPEKVYNNLHHCCQYERQ